MANDFEIGRVVAVDTAQVTIELSADMKALTRSTYEHTVTVGQINSYIILPVGAQKIVGMVTRVMMTEEAELKVDKTMVTLPSARRLMKATMIGAIDGGEFRQGISVFPVLDNPVLVARTDDLNAIFDCRTGSGDACSVAPGPGYCIDIGQSAVFPDYRVQINPDLFFGKHAAILGSTGSGKSCSVATIIQSVLADAAVKNAHFVILDTNGEYGNAFSAQNADERDPARRRVLNISADPRAGEKGLSIPYWFMNSEEFARLFRAAPGIQRPVLLDALRAARVPSASGGRPARLLEEVTASLGRIINTAQRSDACSADVEDLSVGLAVLIGGNRVSLADLFPRISDIETALQKMGLLARDHVGEPAGRRFSKILPPNIQDEIATTLQPFLLELANSGGKASSSGVVAPPPLVSADTPLYFGKNEFRRQYIDAAISAIDAGAKSRDYCATMLMRMHRLLDDRRFEFLFGPVDGEWPEPMHSLATFLRDILGLPSAHTPLSTKADIPPGTLPYYDRQRSGAILSNVVVVDLSLLASEVLENVTALLARLILEFLQRLGTECSGVDRGDLPVVLVLEEAQNYIRERRGLDDESISREVFERIAREGRKYGLSLVVASQRPSELSKTVLSQCNSFVVHRLQNPEDLRYFKEIVPSIYEQLLGQLPALAQRNALVLGECVRAPALVYMREANPRPRSLDPEFHKHWIADEPQLPDVEAVCAAWEGRTLPADVEEPPASPPVADESESVPVSDMDYDPFADD